MAVGPVRTLLEAHLQAGWNRSRRELGKSGRAAFLIVTVVVFLTGALPALCMSLVGGYFLGRGLPSEVCVRILGGILAFLALMGGLVGGLFGSTRVLGWESTRTFPLKLRSLFTAELIAGLGDLLPLSIAFLTACLLLGAAVARPLLLLLLPLPWLGTVGGLLCIQYLAGSLAARVAKHLRLALLLLGFLVWVSSTLLPTRIAHLQKGQGPLPVVVVQGVEHLLKVLDRLPSTQCVQGLGEALAGHWASALGRQAYAAAVLALLLLGAASTLKRDSDPQTLRPVAKGSREKLWSFATPVQGLARLQWQAITSSHLGKFQFLIPLMVLVLLKGPFSMAKGATIFSVPTAFGYLAMAGMQTQLNQFGLDGPGIKALLLLPLRSRDLLVGKALGLLAVLAMQALFLLVLLALFGQLGPVQALAGLCLAGCMFLLQVSLGHWTSVWMPRPMPRDSLKNANQAQPVIWLGFAALFVGTVVFGGSYLLTAWLAPRLLLPVMLLLLGAVLIVYKHFILPAAARYLDGRREVLLQALG